MEIPDNVKTHELRSSVIWLDDEGILYSVPKPGPPPELNREETLKEMEKLKDVIGHKKVCMILESNPNSRPPKKEEREFIAGQINSISKAMAIVTSSPVSKMIANLFFGLQPPPYPTKMFTNEKDAREWIRQYL